MYITIAEYRSIKVRKRQLKVRSIKVRRRQLKKQSFGQGKGDPGQSFSWSLYFAEFYLLCLYGKKYRFTCPGFTLPICILPTQLTEHFQSSLGLMLGKNKI